MADNILVTPGTGTTIAADDIGGVLHQRVKIIHGVDGVNNGDVAATNPLPVVVRDSAGIAIGARPDGFLRAQLDPTTLLFDTFENLDTTNTWTIGGTTAPTGLNGALSASPGIGANASSYARSQPTFIPGSSAYLQFATLVQIESATVTGNQRFWGLGIYTTPTASAPITNGTIFEIDSVAGNLQGAVYSNSVRTQTVSLTRPADGTTHRYAIYYKTSRVYFEIDNVVVGSLPFPNPQVAALSTVIGSVNGAAVVATGPVLNSSSIGVADTGRNATKIADGLFPWRTAQINTDRSLVVTQIDGYKATYSASVANLVAMATAPTDIFTLTGSATKTIRVTRVTINGTQTTASQITIILLKRSTANTAGTSTAQAAVAHDSNSVAATGTVLAYTANPTVGTLVGNLRSRKVIVGAATGISDEFITEFGTRNCQAVVLRGTGQVFAINLNAATIAGSSFNISIEWIEE